MGIHWQELIVILLIVLVLFGPRRLPEIGRSLGNGIREFRDSMTGNGPTKSEDTPALAAAAIPVEVAAPPVEVTTPTATDADPATRG